MKYGYADQVLRIDLTKRRITKTALPQDLVEKFIGGRGFVAKTLFDELPDITAPLSPENVFVMATGPLSGHLLPSSGKTHFGSKSPATGGYRKGKLPAKKPAWVRKILPSRSRAWSGQATSAATPQG